MNCKICKTEIPDDSIYCGMCGARTDGKKTCISCQRDIDENYIYCNYCGARVDGKKVCECGNLYEGNFCFLCGKGQEVSPADKKKKAVSTAEGSLTKKIFSIISGAAALLGALISLIFVFLIGFKLEIPTNLSGIEIPIENANINIYYYFGKYFQEMEGVAETAQYELFRNLLSTDITILGILGIIICSLTLLSVVAFSITALILYLLGWFGKTKACSEKWSLAAIVSFVVGAAAIYSLNKASISVAGSITVGVNLKVDVPTVMNGATKAAIILIAIFAGIFFLCSVLKYNWGALTKKSVLVSVFSFVGVAFTIVLLCVGANVAQFIQVSENNSASIALDVGWLPSNLLWLVALAESYENNMAMYFRGYTEATESLMTMNVCNIIAQVCMIAIFCLIGVVLYKNLKKSEKNVSSIVCSSLALVLSIVVLVLSMISFEKLWFGIDFVGRYEVGGVTTFKPRYTSQIVTVVFTALLTAVSILKAIFAKMKAKNE